MKNTYEETLYTLANGKIEKMESVKKIKVSQAAIFFKIKEMASFREWYAREQLK